MSKRKSANQSASFPVPSTVVVRQTAKESATAEETGRKFSLLERLRRTPSLIPMALAMLTSINTLWLGYAVDDTQQVLNNVVIRSLKNLPLQFTSGVWSFVSIDMMPEQLYYRPLFGVLFTINYALFGSKLWAWHLLNVLIHAAVAGLVYLVIKEFSGRGRTALITASLFAVHPVHAESVAWISGVTDPWMALFFLPAFYCYLRYRKSGKTYLLVLAAALFLPALFAKETALALPLLIAYCELFHFVDGDFKQRLRRLSLVAAGVLAPLVIYLLMRRQALGSVLVSDGAYASLLMAMLTMPLAIVKYLALSALAMPYSYHHLTPLVTSATDVRFLAPFAAVVALICVTLFSASRLLKFAAVWFAATLLPALLAIRYLSPEYIVQDRYLYLPSIGFCLAVALGVEWLTAKVRQENAARVTWATAALLVVVMGAMLMRQNLFWKDDVAVFQRCVAVAPTSADALSQLSLVYFITGRFKEADAEAKRAVELNPQSSNAYMRLSYINSRLGKVDNAITDMEQGIAAIPETRQNRTPLAMMYMSLGLLYSQKKDFQTAEAHIHKSRELRSRALGYYHTGLFYFNQERYEEALSMYQVAMQKFPPNYAPIHLSTAVTYDLLKQKENALAEYGKYLEFAPATAPDRDKVVEMMKRLQPRESK